MSKTFRAEKSTPKLPKSMRKIETRNRRGIDKQLLTLVKKTYGAQAEA